MESRLTEVRIISVPLDRNYKNTFSFSSKGEQTTYFYQQGTFYNATDFSYQRKDGYLRIPKGYDSISPANYIMYKNSDYSDKWFYAFITRMEYKSDDVTWVYFELDVIQSYLFDYTLLDSFVEREHTNDDTIGANTYPENLETGEFVTKWSEKISDLNKKWICVAVTEDIVTDTTGGVQVHGLYSGLVYYTFPVDKIGVLNGFLDLYDEDGKSDAIQSIFIIPEFLADCVYRDNGGTSVSLELFRLIGSTAPKSFEYTLSNYLKKYTYFHKNKKLYCYPYNYIRVSNNNGGTAVYKYEDFLTASDTLKFKIDGVLTPGCSIRMNPINYKGGGAEAGVNVENGLNLGKYPICNWTSDVYTNWLTQNSVNIALNIASGVGQIATGLATGIASGGIGAAVGAGVTSGGVSTIASQLAQIHQMSITPEQSRGNINCGDVIAATNNNTFTFEVMSAKDEYLRIIDDYFTMFGYKCNRVKIPLKDHRSRFWYTKTIDVNIRGAIPQGDLDKIKGCYNNGITFWSDKSVEGFGNYAPDNNII